MNNDGSVETNNMVLKPISGKASAMLCMAGVIVPIPIAMKNTDITANSDQLFTSHFLPPFQLVFLFGKKIVKSRASPPCKNTGRFWATPKTGTNP
jgi:hypothetical protein